MVRQGRESTYDYATRAHRAREEDSGFVLGSSVIMTRYRETRSMPYRDEEEALRTRCDELEALAAGLADELGGLEAEVAATRVALAMLDARLAEAGPGAGQRGVRKDRIDLAAGLLLLVALGLIALQVEWHSYIADDPTVIGAIFLLAAPALLALLVAWPYRAASRNCRWVVRVAAVLCVVPFASVAVGIA
jgi:hypothetical protein